MITFDDGANRDATLNKSQKIQKKATAPLPLMEELDFFLALEGAEQSLQKLDKTLLLELKHLQKSSHQNILNSLMAVSFGLLGVGASKNDTAKAKSLVQTL